MAERAVHVATVHFQSDKWIDIQLDHLHEHITSPLSIYGCLNGIDARHNAKFAWTGALEGSHAAKLNEMANVIAEHADPDDVLVFIDGDAFPIAPLDDWFDATLAKYPLAAVRRDENLGDKQPHPCFCATTVGFWKEIDGDWRRGYRWENSNGRSVTDVGGNLLGILEQRGIEWLPLTRTNTFDLHPIFFGVYGGIVYHHGAGFRPANSRATNTELGLPTFTRREPGQRPTLRWRVERALKKRKAQRILQASAAKNQVMVDEVFASIQTDPEFYKRFTG